MNREEYLHQVVAPLAQILKAENMCLGKFNGWCIGQQCRRAREEIKNVIELNDRRMKILDKLHIDMLDMLPEPPKESVIVQAMKQNEPKHNR